VAGLLALGVVGVAALVGCSGGKQPEAQTTSTGPSASAPVSPSPSEDPSPTPTEPEGLAAPPFPQVLNSYANPEEGRVTGPYAVFWRDTHTWNQVQPSTDTNAQSMSEVKVIILVERELTDISDKYTAYASQDVKVYNCQGNVYVFNAETLRWFARDSLWPRQPLPSSLSLEAGQKNVVFGCDKATKIIDEYKALAGGQGKWEDHLPN
jgi:hypothetical protein